MQSVVLVAMSRSTSNKRQKQQAIRFSESAQILLLFNMSASCIMIFCTISQRSAMIDQTLSPCYVLLHCIMSCLFLCPTRVQYCSEDHRGQLLVTVCFEQRLHLLKGGTSVTGGMGPWDGRRICLNSSASRSQSYSTLLQVGVPLVRSGQAKPAATKLNTGNYTLRESSA